MDTRMPIDFIALVSDQLVAAGAPLPERNAALALLGVIAADLATQSLACRQSAMDLATRLQMDRTTFVAAVRLLSSVGAVTLGSHHHAKRLFVIPPGVRQVGRPRAYPTSGIRSVSATN